MMAEAPPENRGNPPKSDLQQHLLQPSHHTINTEKHFRVCLQVNQENYKSIVNFIKIVIPIVIPIVTKIKT